MQLNILLSPTSHPQTKSPTYFVWGEKKVPTPEPHCVFSAPRWGRVLLQHRLARRGTPSPPKIGWSLYHPHPLLVPTHRKSSKGGRQVFAPENAGHSARLGTPYNVRGPCCIISTSEGRLALCLCACVPSLSLLPPWPGAASQFAKGFAAYPSKPVGDAWGAACSYYCCCRKTSLGLVAIVASWPHPPLLLPFFSLPPSLSLSLSLLLSVT